MPAYIHLDREAFSCLATSRTYNTQGNGKKQTLLFTKGFSGIRGDPLMDFAYKTWLTEKGLVVMKNHVWATDYLSKLL
ncbi:hypothetical protein CEXT_134071 [Caerostris extrusa]|uniref:Uncharacterized protein n=1 Tax=Caerostris extrusa TaxID=172846 RepID=A0AAV4N1V2_CAEEX|nr:hypothetical protein CEXT_134071 [Caerostris extrusa]